MAQEIKWHKAAQNYRNEHTEFSSFCESKNKIEI